MYGRVSFLFLASGSQTRKVPSATALIHFSFFVNSMELVLDQSSINEMSFDLRNFKFSDCPFVQLYVSLASSPGLRAP